MAAQFAAFEALHPSQFDRLGSSYHQIRHSGVVACWLGFLRRYIVDSDLLWYGVVRVWKCILVQFTEIKLDHGL
jgi:hypothetical protein